MIGACPSEKEWLPHPSPQPNAAETPKTNGVHEVRHAFDNMTTEPISEPHSNGANEKSKKELPELDIAGKVRDLICTLSGLEPDMIKPEADLANLGIDSLMGMELAREIEIMFKFHPSAADREADNHEKPHVNRFTHPKANGNMNGGSTKVNGTHSHANDPSMPNDMVVPTIAILDAFRETTQLTDQFIEQNNFGNYVQHTLPRLTKLCVIQIIDGFEELGCSLRDAHLGQILNRIKYLPKHEQFVTFLYGVLEKAGPVDLDGSRMTRTATAVPAESAYTLSQNLALDFPEHTYDSQLTYLTGSKLADYLTGKADGLQLIFASAEGRNIVSGMYGKSPINMQGGAPIKILEIGVDTRGTTARLVPILASLNIPFQYTVSDLSSSLVAGARKRSIVDDFVKKYSSGFAAPVVSKALEEGLEGHVDQCILVTSATGSLGSHLVAYFTKLPNVKRMICVNRYSPSLDCRIRQRKALESKGLFLNSVELAKIHVLETDTVKPMMGLSNLDGKARVPEDRMLVDSVMPTGYGEAKLIWETMLDETLHKYPQHFRPMIVRIGQIAGSEGSGYWNPVEHLAFLIKSSQTLNILPDLEGDLSWCPVNVVAATLGELLLDEQTWYPVYHIENPVRQPRRKMIHMLADDFHIPNTGIIPFKEWLERVRRSPSSPDDNPASNLAGFLDMYFVRMSCGGLILDTARSRENSWTLRDTGPIMAI
uniref:Putative polyketide synthase 38 n=1 Tax=Talaromyces marneffei PM1 TaxID=1077442 RepID=A0A093UMS2_TALMA